MLNLPIYLDNNSTTQMDSRVFEAMVPYFIEHFGNAASKSHSFGWVAEEAVNYAREQVARLIGGEPKEIIFTSGATEADNLALKGVFEMYASKGNHIITTVTEHKAVMDTCKHIEKRGGEITYLPVNNEGLVDLQQLESAIRPNTILIAVMYANNETGTIMPVGEISRIARKHGALFFTDATQAAGKIQVDVNADGIDLMACSAHKLYGPKGVGALYVRRKNPRVKVTAQIDGGGHERGMRSGTLNVPGIVGFGKACEIAMLEMKEEATRITALRDKLESGLAAIPETMINGCKTHRLPNTSNMLFKYVKGADLMTSLNKEIAVSAGSACTSASLEPSYVLKAMGLSDDLAHSALRFSLGRFTTEEQIDYAVNAVKDAVIKLREINPQWEMHKEHAHLINAG